MKKLLIGGVLLCFLFGAAGRAQAATCDTVLSFPLDTVVHNKPGKMITLGSIDTSAYAGGTGTARSQNQHSVHPGNHLHINTSVDSAILTDVEASPDVTRTAGPFTLGDTLTVTLELGSDGIFSGGGDIDICVEDEEPPPTTTPETVPETTPPPTDPPDTSPPSIEPPETTPPDTEPPATTVPPVTEPPGTDPEPTVPPTTPETTPPTTDDGEMPPPESEERPPPLGGPGQPPANPPGNPADPASPAPAAKTLPETGIDETIAGFAALALGAGVITLLVIRRRSV